MIGAGLLVRQDNHFKVIIWGQWELFDYFLTFSIPKGTFINYKYDANILINNKKRIITNYQFQL